MGSTCTTMRHFPYRTLRCSGIWIWYIMGEYDLIGYTYLDPPRGAKWMVRGAILQPLRVGKHHPLEGAGILFYICFFVIRYD